MSIFGVVHLDGRDDAAIDGARLARALGHRDPHGETRATPAPSATLGHRRRDRSVTSLPAGDHPSGVVVVAESRLDERGPLARDLGLDPGRLDVTGDAALVRLAYLRWGVRCVDRLVGDFAFVLWDPRQERLLCARDPFGVVPLHIVHEPGRRVAWASEVGALLTLPGVDAAVDDEALADVLVLTIRTGDATCRRAVRTVEPAHALVVERHRSTTFRWWHPDDALDRHGPWIATDTDYEAAYGEALTRAVHDRLADPGTGAVGAHLSGGLDSSAVAVLAGRRLGCRGEPLTTTAFVSPPTDRHLGTDGTPLIDAVVAAEDGRLASHRIWGAACEGGWQRPVDVGGPTLPPCGDQEFEDRDWFRSAGVSVVLSGWGGDEAATFNGRGYAPQLLRTGRLGDLWRLSAGRTPTRRAGYCWHRAARPLLSAVSGRRPDLTGARLDRWLAFVDPDWARQVELEDRVRRDGMDRGALTDAHRYRADLLTSGHLGRRAEGWDRWGARSGLAYRYPFLDRRLVELCLRIPVDQWARPGESRSLHRRATVGVLPDGVRRARAKDPTVHGLARRLLRDRHHLAAELEDLLTVPTVAGRFRPDAVRALLADLPPESVLDDPATGPAASRDLTLRAAIILRIGAVAEFLAEPLPVTGRSDDDRPTRHHTSPAPVRSSTTSPVPAPGDSHRCPPSSTTTYPHPTPGDDL